MLVHCLKSTCETIRTKLVCELTVLCNYRRIRLIISIKQVINLTEQTKGEFISLEHASRWLGQSVGIPGKDKSFG
ncbi:hypothetical protein HanPI659440_Chr04g0177131 [Helianthus annuus]|nr:hypothetical protein HanPI659440_Chr04g0177131 [Helianthus annuus]